MTRPPCICLGIGCPSCRPARSPWGIGLCSLCGCSLTAEQETEGKLCEGCRSIPRETPEEREVAELRRRIDRLEKALRLVGDVTADNRVRRAVVAALKGAA